ncbi:IS66 family transposase [Polymorphobacter sp. PAMC 29334]|uniref:IS66 family transposase n=1 Tax=Polymorphobacter sp. PAMC 29334 TaxID=2862331 RepID=UPI00351D908F
MVRDAVETIDRTTADLTKSAALAKLQTLRIAKLEHEVARLRRSQFGRSSEQHAADQLRLLFDEAMTSDTVTGAPANDDTPGEDAVPAIRRGGRAPLPAHLPRREIEHLPAAGGDRCDRPGCHGAQVRIGEDITEVLDYIPARFEVIRHIRPRLACRACERIMQAPVPPLPIPKARATSALLAHLLVSRFADHLPWYRQSAILRRAGVAIDRDLMGNWAGKIAWLMVPLVDRMMAHVLAAGKIHGDDTPVTLLTPGAAGEAGTRTAHFWVYLCDDRSSGDGAPPAVVYRFSADRRGAHPAAHLQDYAGYFQADAFAGYNALYRDRATGAARGIVEVGCWSHVRRKFNDVLVTSKGCSAIAAEAITRIGALFAIERRIKGSPPDVRRTLRQTEAIPRLAALRLWLEVQSRGLAPKSDLALACNYALSRWAVMVRYCDDGRLEISNNLVENALRGVSLGRKNWLFVGSAKGGEDAAIFYSLVETCRLNGIDPQAWLTDIIERIGEHPINRIDELLPWVWAKTHGLKIAA